MVKVDQVDMRKMWREKKFWKKRRDNNEINARINVQI